MLSLVLRGEKLTVRVTFIYSETAYKGTKRDYNFFLCRQAPFYKDTLNLDARVSRTPVLQKFPVNPLAPEFSLKFNTSRI